MKKELSLAKLVKKSMIAADVYDFWVENKYIAESAKPGQFLHIKCGDDINTLLRRPISICDVNGDIVRFIFEAKGSGTRLLSQKKEGDLINILGPLGTSFEPKGEKAVILGGGIGTFPLLMLAKKLNRPKLFMGYRNKDKVTLEKEFSECGELFITTDDGSYGHHGYVTDIAKQAIEESDCVYACGPEFMLRAVKALTNGKECYLSMEQRMGCGIGACLTCVCKTVYGYGKVCQHGPVFSSEDVIFGD